MNQYPFERSLHNELDVLDYYSDAINYRNRHKDQSLDIALHVFRRTNPKGMLSFAPSERLMQLRFEFGALEAPGWSKDETKTLEESEDEAWQYLLNLIKKAKKSGTV
jgi:hypothetical protein